MGHTPGPWVVREPQALEHAEVYAEDGGALVAWPIANNARLIAAAPELLVACKHLLVNAEADGWSEFMLADARAAINKAEGRSE